MADWTGRPQGVMLFIIQLLMEQIQALAQQIEALGGGTELIEMIQTEGILVEAEEAE